jgi:hypothetical protein
MRADSVRGEMPIFWTKRAVRGRVGSVKKDNAPEKR